MVGGCDLRLGDSRLQYRRINKPKRLRCDLRLGDSRLQSHWLWVLSFLSCDLRLGDSRLQCISKVQKRYNVVICV